MKENYESKIEMAGDCVVAVARSVSVERAEDGFFESAAVLRVGTARVEGTAGGRG